MPLGMLFIKFVFFSDVFRTFFNRYEDPKAQIRRICGEEVADRCSPIWGLNEEGEINGVWRDLGIPRLWYMTGAYLSFFWDGLQYNDASRYL